MYIVIGNTCKNSCLTLQTIKCRFHRILSYLSTKKLGNYSNIGLFASMCDFMVVQEKDELATESENKVESKSEDH